jgi:sugar phosphate isomerase/epimerase
VLTERDYSISMGQMRGVPLRVAVPAIARAGFSGLVLSLQVYRDALSSGLSDKDILSLFSDNGAQVECLDGVIEWMVGTPVPPDLCGFRDHLAFFEAAAAIGAPRINAVELFHHDPGPTAMADGFAGLCAGAAGYGLSVSLEFSPIGSLRNLEFSNDIVAAAGQANGGLLIDTWHFARSGGRPEHIAGIPAERIFGLQVCDVGAESHDNLMDEAMHHRLLPGEGYGRVAEVLAACAVHGIRQPLSAEVFADALLALPLDEMLERTIAAMRRVSPWEKL